MSSSKSVSHSLSSSSSSSPFSSLLLISLLPFTIPSLSDLRCRTSFSFWIISSILSPSWTCRFVVPSWFSLDGMGLDSLFTRFKGSFFGGLGGGLSGSFFFISNSVNCSAETGSAITAFAFGGEVDFLINTSVEWRTFSSFFCIFAFDFWSVLETKTSLTLSRGFAFERSPLSLSFKLSHSLASLVRGFSVSFWTGFFDLLTVTEANPWLAFCKGFAKSVSVTPLSLGESNSPLETSLRFLRTSLDLPLVFERWFILCNGFKNSPSIFNLSLSISCWQTASNLFFRSLTFDSLLLIEGSQNTGLFVVPLSILLTDLQCLSWLLTDTLPFLPWNNPLAFNITREPGMSGSDITRERLLILDFSFTFW